MLLPIRIPSAEPADLGVTSLSHAHIFSEEVGYAPGLKPKTFFPAVDAKCL